MRLYRMGIYPTFDVSVALYGERQERNEVLLTRNGIDGKRELNAKRETYLLVRFSREVPSTYPNCNFSVFTHFNLSNPIRQCSNTLSP
jgi:hypothetical protein